MESKKRFGEYICRRRKELGLTQREFADKLYVTESAVSKWERGLSYPDVTLLRDICAVLDVSEHELLTASVDTERRTAERLAEKYVRLAKTYRMVQYVIYGATLLGLAAGNQASQGTLSWFWIGLTAVMLAASLTLLPALVGLRQELVPYRASISLGGALASLELLLLVCCLYSGGDWFPMAAVSVLFGMSLFILPVLLRQLPLGRFVSRNKLLAWFAVETALLFLLLAVGQWYDGGDWLWSVGVPVTLVGLSLPWGLLALGRYLPLGVWPRMSLCCIWTGLWLWLSPWAVDRIMLGNGWSDDSYRLSWPFTFSDGVGPVQTLGVIILVMWFVAAALALAGIIASRRDK